MVSVRMVLARFVVLRQALAALSAFVLLFSMGVAASGCQSYDALVAADQVCAQKWADVEANLQRSRRCRR
jgi:hypothetical protein